MPASGSFSVTSDIDWASEACVADFLSLISDYRIRPTVFITHESDVIESFKRAGQLEVGLHPNFLPSSTHGSTISEVVAHVHGLAPAARCFRSHSFMDGTPITDAMRSIGMLYDSNTCLHLQAFSTPLSHWSGLARFPVFWEDDVHWMQQDYTWEFNDYSLLFRQQGIKIINVHPIHVALNTPNAEFYQKLMIRSGELTHADIARLRFKGPGVRTFLKAMLTSLTAGGSDFRTLGEIYDATRQESDL